MLDFAKNNVMVHIGYATKKRVICMECGKRFDTPKDQPENATCPHCSQPLMLKYSAHRTMNQVVYVAIAQTYNEFQVIRNFRVESSHYEYREAKYNCYEILQHWYIDGKKREVVARTHNVCFGADTWTGYMEIRDKNKQNYYEANPRYDIEPDGWHPDSVFKPEFAKYGISSNMEGISFLQAIKVLPDYPQAETLLKANQLMLFRYFLHNSYKVRYRWNSIKICMRNGYKPISANLWLDYLDLLEFFNKDLRNAHYVCPADLIKEHYRLSIKKREILKNEEIERKRQRAIENQKKFESLKHKFFGLVFSDELIQVRVLESVDEVMKEGDAMHHCVFTNDYYLRPDSIILTATMGEEKLETIEFSLSKREVVQCRGKFNKSTEYHDRIVKLVNQNSKTILKRVTQSAG